MPAFLLEELAKQFRGKRPDDLTFPPVYEERYLRGSVFRSCGFDDAARAIGKPQLTPHVLRHTAASLAIHAGANIKAIQRMLGYADASITLNRCGHLYEDDLDAVADRMDALRRSSVG